MNPLSGGLKIDDSNPENSLQNMRLRLNVALKLFHIRFKQIESGKETMTEMLSFVAGLGLVALKDLYKEDYELHIRLESLLIEVLNEEYQRQTFDQMGLTSTNQKLRKKKLKRKQKLLQAAAREQLSKQENQKKQAIEENRQMQLISEAEANPQPDQA